MTAEINQIYVNSNLTVENGYSNTLCFIDGKAADKSRYTLENNELSIYKEAKDYISVFYNTNSSSTYYFEKVLNEYGIIVFGKDKLGKKLTGLRTDNVLIFVDGILLKQSEYNVLDNGNVALLVLRDDMIFHDVVIYVANESLIYGVLDDPMNINCDPEDPNYPNNINNRIGYTKETTLIFMNGQYVSPNKIETVNGYTYVNFVPKASDKFVYYKLNSNTISINFESTPGITTYGPIDDYNITIPNLYDSSVSFDDLAKVVVDDLRPGFVICEKDRAGRLLVADTNYETNKIKTITLQPFSNNVYSKDEYYLEVPEAKNITDYLSDYDKTYVMIPEILRIFQRFLLDEVHDEIERIKNIRNVRKVNSDHIYKLIRLLGMDLDIKHLNIKQMQEALDELTEFYRIAGTKQSLNYFNIVQDNTKLINIKQLYTFHKKRQKEDKNKIYSYSYSLYENGGVTYGGSGYVPGEKYKVINRDGTDSNIIIEVKEVGENGCLVNGGFSANLHEGKVPYSILPLELTTNSVGALLDCNSVPYIYDYDCAVTSGDGSVFRVGDVLTTPLFSEGSVIVDSVDGSGKITGAHLTLTSGTTSYSNIVNTPLQPQIEDSNLQLAVEAKTLSTIEIFNLQKGGLGTFKVGETALYKITFSGGGGSGGAADTGYGSTNDSPATGGYSGEKKTITIPCSAGTTIEFYIGEGGKASYARGNSEGSICGKGGIGGDNGKMGVNKNDDMMGTRRKKWNGSTKYYCCLVNGTHYHGSHYVASKAASGAGGGGTYIKYNGKQWTARGGNGGSATWSNNQHEGSNVVLDGGKGGYGGTTNGTGSKGGKRNQNDNTFWSEAGQDGYVIIEKITQVYNENAKLINNENLRITSGATLKTTDNMFTINAYRVEDGKIIDFDITPQYGAKPIYTLDSNGNINGYSKVFDVVNVTQEAFLTINQTVNTYKYNLNIKNSNGVYKEDQILTDSNNIFTITTTSVPDGTIKEFTYTPTQGTQNINFQDSILTTEQGGGAQIVITSTADVDVQNIEREYVDFYLPEEQGAVWKKEYRIPMVDYGYVNQGSPSSPNPWAPGNPDIDYGTVSEGTPNAPYPEDVYGIHTETIVDGAVSPQYDIQKQITTKGPIGNPDIDYGYVSEKIKGKWVEWLEWDRPADLYPTNHVEVEVNILSVEDYDQAMARFYKQFYSLASTVLYIHRLVTVYNFGNNTTANITADEQDTSGSMILMGFMTTQPYDDEIYTMTCDPSRQNCYGQEI